ncbi:C-type lectin domain family 4 member M-like, partial [Hyalella azteca]|uniref:C-type lectin domain family 4 member M-like n=1 Tax=Hyalella azteca TaxID=294128 RepID=A0A8B7P4F6_HYAAZ
MSPYHSPWGDRAAATLTKFRGSEANSTDFNNGYWLGATNGTLTNVWQWSDGAAVQMGAPYVLGRGLCQNPFVLVGTQCVHLITTNYTWHDARNQCGLVGGGLIVVDDCDQYHKVALYLAEQDYPTFWIGGSDEAVEGQWRWVDGSPMTMRLPYWATTDVLGKEPDNPGEQNCLELNCAGMYRFSSAWCSHVRRVI